MDGVVPSAGALGQNDAGLGFPREDELDDARRELAAAIVHSSVPGRLREE